MSCAGLSHSSPGLSRDRNLVSGTSCTFPPYEARAYEVRSGLQRTFGLVFDYRTMSSERGVFFLGGVDLGSVKVSNVQPVVEMYRELTGNLKAQDFIAWSYVRRYISFNPDFTVSVSY